MKYSFYQNKVECMWCESTHAAVYVLNMSCLHSTDHEPPSAEIFSKADWSKFWKLFIFNQSGFTGLGDSRYSCCCSVTNTQMSPCVQDLMLILFEMWTLIQTTFPMDGFFAQKMRKWIILCDWLIIGFGFCKKIERMHLTFTTAPAPDRNYDFNDIKWYHRQSTYISTITNRPINFLSRP